MSTAEVPFRIWLETADPVEPLNAAMSVHAPGVGAALRQGLIAVPDAKRPGFFDIQVGQNWFYILVDRNRVHLIAVRVAAPSDASSENLRPGAFSIAV